MTCGFQRPSSSKDDIQRPMVDFYWMYWGIIPDATVYNRHKAHLVDNANLCLTWYFKLIQRITPTTCLDQLCMQVPSWCFRFTDNTSSSYIFIHYSESKIYHRCAVHTLSWNYDYWYGYDIFGDYVDLIGYETIDREARKSHQYHIPIYAAENQSISLQAAIEEIEEGVHEVSLTCISTNSGATDLTITQNHVNKGVYMHSMLISKFR